MNPTGSEKGRLLNKSKPGHIIIMYLKLKKKENFENSKKKTNSSCVKTLQFLAVKLTAKFLSTNHISRKWREKDHQPRII